MWMWRSEMRRMIDDQAERIDELEKNSGAGKKNWKNTVREKNLW